MMNLRRRNILPFAIAILPVLLSACVGSTELRTSPAAGELVVEAGASVPIVIAGQRLSMTVDPGIGARRLLNKSTADVLKLKGSGIQGLYRAGPIELIARSASVESVLGSSTGKLRFHWFDRDVDFKTAGLISPTLLPYAVVTMRLRPTESDERIQAIPFRGASSFGFSGGFGVIFWGDKEVSVGLDPTRRATLVSAPVGALLMAQLGGSFDQDAQAIPIRYGVSRPVRTLRLARPFQFAGLNINSLLVQGSGGNASQEINGSDANEEEVVVVGTKRKQRLTVTVGSDDLRHCSFVRFNNAAAKLELSCR